MRIRSRVEDPTETFLRIVWGRRIEMAGAGAVGVTRDIAVHVVPAHGATQLVVGPRSP
jgi:hypothetical protein